MLRPHPDRYLISQRDTATAVSDGMLSREFAVLGSTGNVYNVRIAQTPHCSCPDHERGNLCKHIIFVLLRVLGLSASSELVYQTSLLQKELSYLFDIRDAATAHSSVLAKR